MRLKLEILIDTNNSCQIRNADSQSMGEVHRKTALTV